MRYGISLLFAFAAALLSAQEVVITSPNPATNGLFGIRATATDNLIVVSETGANNFNGQVHIFRFEAGVATFVQTLTNPDTNGGSFGFGLDAVSTEAGRFIAVGAAFNNVAPPEKSGTGTVQTGQVFIYFDANSDSSDQFQLLTTVNLAELIISDARFGVALDLDVVPGGLEMAVGATGYRNSQTLDATGAVAIFSSVDGSSWTRDQFILPTNITDAGEFGLGLQLEGDRLFVGATSEPIDTFFTGEAFMYQRSAQTKNLFDQVAQFQPSDASTIGFGLFGESMVYLSNGLLCVSAPRATVNQTSGGKVYVFNTEGAQGVVNEQQILLPKAAVEGGFFGGGMAASPDNALYLGDTGFTVAQNNYAGAIEVFSLDQNLFVNVDTIFAETPGVEAYFGEFVSFQVLSDGNFVFGGSPSETVGKTPAAGKLRVIRRETATPIFTDGFESGDTSAWSSSVPRPSIHGLGEFLAVNNAARLRGSFGLQVAGGITNSFVQSDMGDSAQAFRCRFMLSTNDLVMANGNRMRVFTAGSMESGAQPWLLVDLVRESGQFALQLMARNDDDSLTSSETLPLSGPWQAVVITLDPGDGTGAVTLAVNGETVPVSALTNSAANIDFMRLGVMRTATPAPDPISGSLYFDDFSAQLNGSLDRVCLSESELISHAGDWDSKDILHLVALVNWSCP